MKLLLKIPTKSRPDNFLSALNKASFLADNLSNITLLVSYDEDDLTMTESILDQAELLFPNSIFKKGNSISKIHACNRDIECVSDWDIIVLLSDDMICQQKGWDTILIKEMQNIYPDTDGVLFHNDGYCQDRLNTMCILGKKYYDRFKTVYNSEYKSLWCDNEFMLVANKLGKQTYFDQVLFTHNHPANTQIPQDELYKLNESFYHSDKATFDKRKLINFGL